jgi:hypothetical protein
LSENSLRDDLLSIPGVEGAEIEGSAQKPAGLRIRIAEGADQRAVGGAIRRVLTSHGLGTDTRLPGEPDSGPARGIAAVPEPDDRDADDGEVEPMPDGVATAVAVDEEPPRAGQAPVIDLTDHSLDDAAPDEASAPAGESGDAPDAARPAPDDVEPVPTEEPVSTEGPVSTEEPEPIEPEAVEPEPMEPEAVESEPMAPGSFEAPRTESVPAASEAPGPPDGGVSRLASVSVEEGRDGIVITVATTAGDHVRQAAASTEGGVESAVVRATARLALPHAPDATVVDIEDRRVEGADIVMIVLDVDGRLHAGSAVVAAGRAFALGRATWAALTL